MKLKIKEKYFEEIKQGKKSIEFRDAHITFQNEKTGEELKRDVLAVRIIPTAKVRMPEKERKQLFQDEFVIGFKLADGAGRTKREQKK